MRFKRAVDIGLDGRQPHARGWSELRSGQYRPVPGKSASELKARMTEVPDGQCEESWSGSTPTGGTRTWGPWRSACTSSSTARRGFDERRRASSKMEGAVPLHRYRPRRGPPEEREPVPSPRGGAGDPGPRGGAGDGTATARAALRAPPRPRVRPEARALMPPVRTGHWLRPTGLPNAMG